MAFDLSGLEPVDDQGSQALDLSGLEPVAQPAERAPPETGAAAYAEAGSKLVENAPAMLAEPVVGLAAAAAEPGHGEMQPGANVADKTIPASVYQRMQEREREITPERQATADQLNQIGRKLSDDIAANAPNVEPGSVPALAYEVGSGLVQAAPILAATLATGGAGGLGLAVGGFGAQAYGERFIENQKQGRTPEEATQDAAFSAVASGIPMALPVGFLMKPGGTFLAKTLGTSGLLTLQSAFTEALQSGYDKGTITPDMTWGDALARIGHAGLVGGLTGGIMGAGTHALTREAPQGLVEQSRTAPAPVTPEDAASPIPTELIAQGRGIMQEADAHQQANDVLRRSDVPGLGSAVTVDLGDGRTADGTVTDAYSHQGNDGVKITLSDGTVLNDFVGSLQEQGITIRPAELAPEVSSALDKAEQDVRQAQQQAPEQPQAPAQPEQAGEPAAPEQVSVTVPETPALDLSGLVPHDLGQDRNTGAGVTGPAAPEALPERPALAEATRLPGAAALALAADQSRPAAAPAPLERGPTTAPAPASAIQPPLAAPARAMPAQTPTFDPTRYLPQARAYVRDRAGPLTPDALGNHLGVPPADAQRVLGALASGTGSGLQVGRDGALRRIATSTGPVDALTFLARNGGIRDDEGHALRQSRDLQSFVPGAGPLIRKTGMGIDQAGELLHEGGYFGNPDTTPRPGPAEVLDLLERASGQKVYTPEDQATVAAREQAAESKAQTASMQREVQALGKQMGEPLSRQEIQAIVTDMIREDMDAHDALVAYIERQAIQHEDDLHREAPNAGHDIPFDHLSAEPPKAGGAAGEGVERPAALGEGQGQRGEVSPPAAEARPPQEDLTAQGRQLVIPGAEKIGDKALAERQIDKPLRSDKAQLNTEGLELFDPSASPLAQRDIFDRPPEPRASETPTEGAPEAPSPSQGQRSTEMLQDAGERIGGARKDLWAERGLRLSDLDSMTAGEAARYVTKDGVWPKPDYATLVEGGMEPKAAAMLKIVRDRLSATPRNDTPEGRRAYVEMLGHVREVMESAKTVNEMKAARDAILHDKLGWPRSGRLPDAEADRTIREKLFSIFKGRTEHLGIGYDETRKADAMVRAGFPKEPDHPALRGVEIVPNRPDNGPESFYIRRNGKFVKSGFESEQAAKDWLVAQHEGKRGADGEGGALPERPHLDNLERAGPDYRAGRDVTGDDFLKDFGFRGVEFGNWVASDERQRSVNLAYDALHDLAHVLDIPAKALSLDGKMGLAFGARGSGRAAAHYEGDKLVINLTKLSGAGSLAHEWGHALDHYFGEIDQPNAYQGKPRGASGWYDRARSYAGEPLERINRETRQREQFYRLQNLRPEMSQAFDGVMDAIFRRDKTAAEDVRDKELQIENTRASIESYEKQLARHNQQEPSAQRVNRKWAQQVTEHIDMLKRILPKQEEALAKARGEGYTPGKRVDSSYLEQARKLSGKSRDDGYWTRPTEMFARAFESYVFDKVKAEGLRDDYLVHGVEGDRYSSDTYKGNPYPSGAERAAIDAAFDHLFEVMKTREGKLGENTALYAIRREPAKPEQSRAARAWLDAVGHLTDPEKIAGHPATDRLFGGDRGLAREFADMAARDSGSMTVPERILALREQLYSDIAAGAGIPDDANLVAKVAAAEAATGLTAKQIWGRFNFERTGYALEHEDAASYPGDLARIREALGAGAAPVRPADARRRAEGPSGELDRSSGLTDLAPKLRAELDKAGLSDIGLKLEDSITRVVKGEATAADASYLKGLVTVALDAPDKLSALRHETIHALKDMGLFRPAEWTTLEKAAKADSARMADIAKRYGDLTPEQRVEEAVADMYADWSKGQLDNRSGFLKSAFQRVRAFLAGVGRVLKGEGFHSADDVFRSVDRGEVGSRERPTSELAAEAKTPEARQALQDGHDHISDTMGEPMANVVDMAAKASLRQPADKVLSRARDILGRSSIDLKKASDPNFFARELLHPRMIASMYPTFARVYHTAVRMMAKRDTLVSGLARTLDPYNRLSIEDRAQVDKALELGRLQKQVLVKGNELRNGGKSDEGGKAVLSKPGERIQLTPAQLEAYHAVRKGMDDALTLYKDQFLRERQLPEDTTADSLRKEDGKDPYYSKVADMLEAIEQAKRDGYVPFTRYGTHGIVVKIGGMDGPTVHFEKLEIGNIPIASRETAKQRAAEIKAKLEKQYPVGDGYTVSDWFQTADTHALQTHGISLADIDQLAKVGEADPGAYNQVRSAFEAALAKRGFRKHFLGASNTPGYSTDFQRSIADYVVGLSGYLSRRDAQPEFDSGLAMMGATKNPDGTITGVTKQPKLLKYAEEYVHYIQSPANEFQRARQLTFFYYMAGNPSSALVNLTQVPLATAPYLSQFAGNLRVAKELTSAYADVAKMMTTRKGMDLFDPSKAPADIREAITKAFDDGTLLPQQTYEQMATANGRNEMIRSLGKRMRTVADVATLMFTASERANRLVTWIASHRLAQDPAVAEKMDSVLKNNALWREQRGGNVAPVDPSDAAKWVTDETQFVMGKVNRPEVGRGPGAWLLQFQTYGMQMLELMGRLATQNGMEGKRALAGMMGVMGAFGGVLGLPAAQNLVDLFEAGYKKLTGIDVDVEKELRVLTYNLTGSPMLAEAVARGPMRLTGLDLSNRVGMGNTFPVNEIAGLFGTDDNSQRPVPLEMTVGRAARAIDDLKHGDKTAAFSEFMPAMIRNPMQALAWAEQGVRSGKTGKVVIPPEKVTAGDVLAKTAGFTPTHISEMREGQYAADRAAGAATEYKQAITLRLARAYADKIRHADDPQAMQDANGEIADLTQEIRDHNATAPVNERIILDRNAMAMAVRQELIGALAKRPAKIARGTAGELRSLYAP